MMIGAINFIANISYTAVNCIKSSVKSNVLSSCYQSCQNGNFFTININRDGHIIGLMVGMISDDLRLFLGLEIHDEWCASGIGTGSIVKSIQLYEQFDENAQGMINKSADYTKINV